MEYSYIGYKPLLIVEIPTIVIPQIQTIETISIPLPTADVPSYIPMVVPPSDLEAPEGVQAEAKDEPEATGIRLSLIHI